MKSTLLAMSLCVAVPILSAEEETRASKQNQEVHFLTKAGIVTVFLGSFIFLLHIVFDDFHD